MVCTYFKYYVWAYRIATDIYDICVNWGTGVDVFIGLTFMIF